MQEHQVTIGKQTFPVPAPFLVLATQNPIESDGTYPLPEAQVDRFLMKVVVDYPNFSEEMTIVARSLVDPPTITQMLSLEQLQALQAHTQTVYVDRLVAEYAVALCDATRHPATYQLPDLGGYIAYGASAREAPSTWSRPPGPWPCSGAAATACPKTSKNSPATSCATAWSSPTRPWPNKSPPTASSPPC